MKRRTSQGAYAILLTGRLCEMERRDIVTGVMTGRKRGYSGARIVVSWAPRAGVLVVIELRFRPVLGHDEVYPAVPVVVGEGRAPLVPVDGDPGDLPRNGLERAVAPVAQQQAAPGIVARRADFRGIEVLAQ